MGKKTKLRASIWVPVVLLLAGIVEAIVYQVFYKDEIMHYVSTYLIIRNMIFHLALWPVLPFFAVLLVAFCTKIQIGVKWYKWLELLVLAGYLICVAVFFYCVITDNYGPSVIGEYLKWMFILPGIVFGLDTGKFVKKAV